AGGMAAPAPAATQEKADMAQAKKQKAPIGRLSDDDREAALASGSADSTPRAPQPIGANATARAVGGMPARSERKGSDAVYERLALHASDCEQVMRLVSQLEASHYAAENPANMGRAYAIRARCRENTDEAQADLAAAARLANTKASDSR